MKFEDVMKNLDKYRGREHKEICTKQQKELLLKAREGDAKVPWPTMVQLWREIGWGEITDSGLRYRYNQIINRNDSQNK